MNEITFIVKMNPHFVTRAESLGTKNRVVIVNSYIRRLIKHQRQDIILTRVNDCNLDPFTKDTLLVKGLNPLGSISDRSKRTVMPLTVGTWGV